MCMAVHGLFVLGCCGRNTSIKNTSIDCPTGKLRRSRHLHSRSGALRRGPTRCRLRSSGWLRPRLRRPISRTRHRAHGWIRGTYRFARWNTPHRRTVWYVRMRCASFNSKVTFGILKRNGFRLPFIVVATIASRPTEHIRSSPRPTRWYTEEKKKNKKWTKNTQTIVILSCVRSTKQHKHWKKKHKSQRAVTH